MVLMDYTDQPRMQAYRLLADGSASLAFAPVPAPTPGHALLKVTAAGVCHSDLTIIANPSRLKRKPPITLGHEIAGVVCAVRGHDRDGLDPGQQVLVYGVVGCGRCRSCSGG